nr:unnamed protein product [Spirometra erinaceieuropaei]
MQSHSDKLSPRETRPLDYISQFTSDIRHIDGSRNEVADALSRPSTAHLQLSSGIDLTEMAAEERRAGSPCDEDVSELQLQELSLTTGNGTILCNVSTPSHRPFVPPSSSLHNLSNPGRLANDKLASDRFVWPGIHQDLKAWTRTSSACQRSKIQRHNKTPIDTFPGPRSRLSHVHLDIVGPLPLSNDCSYLLTGSLGGLKQFPCLTLLLQRWSSASPSYLEKDMAKCLHVYLRCDRVRRPLEPPYDGPFRVLCRGMKTFRIQRDNRDEWWNQDPHAAGSSILPYEQGMFNQNRDGTSYSDSIPSVSQSNTYKWPNCATAVSTLSVASSSTTPMTFKDTRNAEGKDDSSIQQDISFNSVTSIWTTGTEHTAVRWRSAPSRLGTWTRDDSIYCVESPSDSTSAISQVGSGTIPTSSHVAAVTSFTAAATNTTTAAVVTNAIKEVATPTFSTTSSVHGADFTVTKSTANVSLSAGLGVVQTIDATTTASPTAATLGHPDTPNATQSVLRTGTPTTTSNTTAIRMVDIEAGGDSSVYRRLHASVSVSDAVPCRLPDSVSTPKCTDCVAVAVAVVAENLNPIDTTAGTLVDADPFPTTFPSTVSNPRGVEGVESIAIINPTLPITRTVDNVYLVSTIIILITLHAAGAVEDVDGTAAALIAATTPIHFASLACR